MKLVAVLVPGAQNPQLHKDLQCQYYYQHLSHEDQEPSGPQLDTELVTQSSVDIPLRKTVCNSVNFGKNTFTSFKYIGRSINSKNRHEAK